jgi:hypothetical protein
MELAEGKEEAIPLETLGDVRRFLARVSLEMYRKKLDSGAGHGIVIALGTLAKVMQDQRDSLWKRRTREMWEAHKARRAPTGEPANAQH